MAIDSDVGVLVETGIGLEARFGFLTAFEDAEIMVEEADTPLESIRRGIVLKRVGLALGFFDEFAV